MPDQTENLALPHILPAQAQKHVTHNEAIRMLDALVHIELKSMGENTPPSSPAPGERHAVGSAPVDDWMGQSGKIAAWQDGAWAFLTPQPGWLARHAGNAKLVVFDGNGWIDAVTAPVELHNMTGVGVGTGADAINRLAVAAPATLLTHEGAGHQLKINKNTATDTASVLFQTGWSGRAEFGLAGDDDWRVKVSADGTSWHEALVADRNDGRLAVQGLRSIVANNAAVGQLIMTPGGKQETKIWRLDAQRSGLPRTATIASVNGDKITLTTAEANKFFANAQMLNVSYVRIWNASKLPEQSAWIRQTGNESELFVLEPSDIATWTAGDTIRIGEPGTGSITRCAAVDNDACP